MMVVVTVVVVVVWTSRHRCMSLLIPRWESPLVKALRVVLNRSVSVLMMIVTMMVVGVGGDGAYFFNLQTPRNLAEMSLFTG